MGTKIEYITLLLKEMDWSTEYLLKSILILLETFRG